MTEHRDIIDIRLPSRRGAPGEETTPRRHEADDESLGWCPLCMLVLIVPYVILAALLAWWLLR